MYFPFNRPLQLPFGNPQSLHVEQLFEDGIVGKLFDGLPQDAAAILIVLCHTEHKGSVQELHIFRIVRLHLIHARIRLGRLVNV